MRAHRGRYPGEASAANSAERTIAQELATADPLGWDFQNPSQADQQLRVLEQLFFLHYWRQKLLLDIDHDERALAGIQRTACGFAVFAGDRTDIAENGRHKGIFQIRFYP